MYSYSDSIETLSCGMCVWAAGTAARPLTELLANHIGPTQIESVTKTGRIKVDPWMRIIGLFPENSEKNNQNREKNNQKHLNSNLMENNNNIMQSSSSTRTQTIETEVINTNTSSSSNINNNPLQGSLFVMGDSSYFNWGVDFNATTIINTVPTTTSSASSSITSDTNTNNNKIITTNMEMNIMLIGDPYNPLPLKNPLPQTAQQGAYLARLLNRGYDLQQPIPRIQVNDLRFRLSRSIRKNQGDLLAKPFSFFNLGMIIRFYLLLLLCELYM